MFAVSNATWNDRSWPHEDNGKPDFIVDGHTERLLLDGDEKTCLPPLTVKRSFVRLNAFVYTEMADGILLEILVTGVGCHSPGMLVYYEQKCTGVDAGNLIQCRLDGSNHIVRPSNMVACAFACTSPFLLQRETRVLIQIEILPWEMRDSVETKVCGLKTI